MCYIACWRCPTSEGPIQIGIRCWLEKEYVYLSASNTGRLSATIFRSCGPDRYREQINPACLLKNTIPGSPGWSSDAEKPWRWCYFGLFAGLVAGLLVAGARVAGGALSLAVTGLAAS